MAYGYVGDVNNSISMASSYPGGRTFAVVPPASNRYRLRNNSMGELAAVNQGRGMSMAANGTAAAPNNAENLPPVSDSPAGKPLTWWIVLIVIFILLVWLMKKYAPGERKEFGNINPGLYNGVFLTLYIVLILNVLKVFATKFKIPGLSELILAA